jgi:hypothetical protein
MQADTPAEPTEPVEDPPASTIPLVVAADVQDHLIAACNDLQRLQVLLADACQVLLASFHTDSRELNQHRRRKPERELATVLTEIQQQLDNAVTALQFHDMTSQLIAHTHARLRNCADQLAGSLFADDEDGAAVIEAAPDRPNPVTQSEMDAGSIELF